MAMAMAKSKKSKGTKISLAELQVLPVKQVDQVMQEKISKPNDRVPKKTLDFPTLGKSVKILNELQCLHLLGVDGEEQYGFYNHILDENISRLEKDENSRKLLDKLCGDSRKCVRAVLGKLAMLTEKTKNDDEIASEEAEIRRHIASLHAELKVHEDAIKLRDDPHDYKQASYLRSAIAENTNFHLPFVKIDALKHLHALLEFQQQMHLAVFHSKDDALDLKISATFLQWKTMQDAFDAAQDVKKHEERLLKCFKKIFPRTPFKKWSSSVTCANGRSVVFQHFAPRDGTMCTPAQIWVMAAHGDGSCLIDFMDDPAHRAPDAIKDRLKHSRSCFCDLCDSDFW
jgi:hypothetical protein